MNANTKEDLKDFIAAVEDLAYAVSSVAGTHSTGKLLEAGQKLRLQLDHDETILE